MQSMQIFMYLFLFKKIWAIPICKRREYLLHTIIYFTPSLLYRSRDLHQEK